MSYSHKQSHESGAILGFILVILVLIGLLAGGLWFIKNRADIAAKTDTTTQQAKEETKKATDQAKEEPKKDDTTSNAQPSGSTSSSQNTAGTSTTSGSSTASKPSTSSSTPAPSAVATTGPTHIATTGPEDVIKNAYLIGSLVIVVYLYRLSRIHAR